MCALTRVHIYHVITMATNRGFSVHNAVRLKRLRHGYVTCTSPPRGLISVVCDVEVHGSILTVSIDFFVFFSQKNLSFLASSNILDDP